jgi:predicted transcriptional regulator
MVANMTTIEQLWRQAAVTQQELASLAGDSQSSIAAYEAGRKSPTLSRTHKAPDMFRISASEKGG